MTTMSHDEPMLVRSFPVVDPLTGSNRLVAGVIAECVRNAHEINPNSWVVTHHEGTPTLIVGNIDVAVSAWFSGGYGLTVCREGATLEQLEMIGAHKNQEGWSFASQPWSTYVRLPNDEYLAERLAVLAPCYCETVSRLAAMKGTSHARLHREDMRHAVEVLTGTWLPTPAYVTAGNANHPQSGRAMPAGEPAATPAA